jgi:hypothetical protein
MEEMDYPQDLPNLALREVEEDLQTKLTSLQSPLLVSLAHGDRTWRVPGLNKGTGAPTGCPIVVRRPAEDSASSRSSQR